VIRMDMPADFALKVALHPSLGEERAATSICVRPGYQSGRRPASLKSAMVSSGEAYLDIALHDRQGARRFLLPHTVPSRSKSCPAAIPSGAARSRGTR
jgi:hypothetical protein